MAAQSSAERRVVSHVERESLNLTPTTRPAWILDLQNITFARHHLVQHGIHEETDEQP
jgi:hypothetical protein